MKIGGFGTRSFPLKYRKYLIYLIESDINADVNQDYFEWGFDLTVFGRGANGVAKFIELLDAFNIPHTPERLDESYKRPLGFRSPPKPFLWRTQDLALITANNPITGEYRSPNEKPDLEIGYAGSVGIFGKRDLVLKMAENIRLLAEYIKENEESPGERGFI